MSDTWTSLEVAKILIGALTPLSVATIGWFISKSLKRLDHSLWTNQKLTEKRLSIYDEVAPKLNSLLCFYTWVGHWKEIGPIEVIKIKRELDTTFNVYQHIFEHDVYAAYQEFFRTLFETYTKAGQDAKLRTVISGLDGDRTSTGKIVWDPGWSEYFSTSTKVAGAHEIRLSYHNLMSALTRSVGAK